MYIRYCCCCCWWRWWKLYIEKERFSGNSQELLIQRILSFRYKVKTAALEKKCENHTWKNTNIETNFITWIEPPPPPTTWTENRKPDMWPKYLFLFQNYVSFFFSRGNLNYQTIFGVVRKYMNWLLVFFLSLSDNHNHLYKYKYKYRRPNYMQKFRNLVQHQ